MNRLKLQRFYLVGPMDSDRDGGKIWRKDMTEWLLDRNALPLDPYHKPLKFDPEAMEDDTRFAKIMVAKKICDWEIVSKHVHRLRVVDLRMVDGCDAVICYLDLDKNPCGSYEEIFTVNRSKKPIIVMCPQGMEAIPNWLYGTLPYQMMFDRWDEVEGYLNYIDTAPEIDLMDRWRFFDLEPMIRKVLKCDYCGYNIGGHDA